MIFNRVNSSLVIFSLLLSLLAQADNPTTSATDIKDFLPQQCYFSGHFAQIRTVASIPAPLESQGTFLFSCAHGLIWHTETPTIETVIYTNGKRHFQVDSKGRGEPLKGRLHANMALLLNGLMGADVSYLEKYFSLGAVESDHVELHPKKKNMRKFIDRLDLYKREGSVDISLVNDAHNNTIIRIFDIQTLDQFSVEQCRRFYSEPTDICNSLLRDAGK